MPPVAARHFLSDEYACGLFFDDAVRQFVFKFRFAASRDAKNVVTLGIEIVEHAVAAFSREDVWIFGDGKLRRVVALPGVFPFDLDFLAVVGRCKVVQGNAFVKTSVRKLYGIDDVRRNVAKHFFRDERVLLIGFRTVLGRFRALCVKIHARHGTRAVEGDGDILIFGRLVFQKDVFQIAEGVFQIVLVFHVFEGALEVALGVFHLLHQRFEIVIVIFIQAVREDIGLSEDFLDPLAAVADVDLVDFSDTENVGRHDGDGNRNRKCDHDRKRHRKNDDPGLFGQLFEKCQRLFFLFRRGSRFFLRCFRRLRAREVISAFHAKPLSFLPLLSADGAHIECFVRRLAAFGTKTSLIRRAAFFAYHTLYLLSDRS